MYKFLLKSVILKKRGGALFGRGALFRENTVDTNDINSQTDGERELDFVNHFVDPNEIFLWITNMLHFATICCDPMPPKPPLHGGGGVQHRDRLT